VFQLQAVRRAAFTVRFRRREEPTLNEQLHDLRRYVMSQTESLEELATGRCLVALNAESLRDICCSAVVGRRSSTVVVVVAPFHGAPIQPSMR
jgi:hypothetical protein